MLKFMERQEIRLPSAQLAPFVPDQHTIFRVDTNLHLKNREKFECCQFTPCLVTQDVFDLVLQWGGGKGPEGLVFENKQGKIVEKVSPEESTIIGAAADTTGVNDPQIPDSAI